MCQKLNVKHCGNSLKRGLKLIVSLSVVSCLVVSPLLALGTHEVNWGLKSIQTKLQSSQKEQSTASTESLVANSPTASESSSSQEVISTKQSKTLTKPSKSSESEEIDYLAEKKELEKKIEAVKAYLESADYNNNSVVESNGRQVAQTSILKSSYDSLADSYAESLSEQSVLMTANDIKSGQIKQLEKDRNSIKKSVELGALYNTDDGLSVGGMVGSKLGNTGITTHVGLFMPIQDASNLASYTDVSNYTGLATVGITW